MKGSARPVGRLPWLGPVSAGTDIGASTRAGPVNLPLTQKIPRRVGRRRLERQGRNGCKARKGCRSDVFRPDGGSGGQQRGEQREQAHVCVLLKRCQAGRSCGDRTFPCRLREAPTTPRPRKRSTAGETRAYGSPYLADGFARQRSRPVIPWPSAPGTSDVCARPAVDGKGHRPPEITATSRRLSRRRLFRSRNGPAPSSSPR